MQTTGNIGKATAVLALTPARVQDTSMLSHNGERQMHTLTLIASFARHDQSYTAHHRATSSKLVEHTCPPDACQLLNGVAQVWMYRRIVY